MRAYKMTAGLVFTALAMWAGIACAQTPAATFVEGKDYVRLAVPQPVAHDGKVDVVEFFWYGCPHCYRWQPMLQQWLAAHDKQIHHRLQPAVLGKSWEVMAKAYHAMVGVGGFDPVLHEKFYAAIHDKNEPIQTLEGGMPTALFAMVAAEKGAPYAAKFRQRYMGAQMAGLMKKDHDTQERYHLEGTPAIVVAGKYSVSPLNTMGNELQMLPVVNFLVKKAAAEMAAAKK